MAYADQQMSSNRIVAIIIVALLHIFLGWALVSGLAMSATEKLVEQLTTVDIEEEVEEEPPEEPDEPPPPEETSPPPPVAPPPPVNINPQPPQIETQQSIPPPVPDPRPPQPAPVAPPPAPPPPPPPSLAQGATPKSQNRWARRIQENYPSRALREEVEGTVGVSVTVGANGRVSGCNVTRSSGSSVLDAAACKGMQRYARFNPALDDAGNPTNGSHRTSITYRLN